MRLQRGSTGENVRTLQEKLGLTADGSFGPITEKTVRDWQKANRLTETGIVDQTMWNVLFPNSGLKIAVLQGHIPINVLSQIPDTAARFNITTNLRLAHFLAQCSHESGNFTTVQENLNYSAAGLLRIFSKYFNESTAAAYARQPEKIANRVYASRMGNGNEASGDGWRFRGRGYIQLTGKSNYEIFDKTVDDNIIADPDLVATKYPLSSAAFFFNNNGLWSICDKGSDTATVTAVTRRVNGGTIGLDHRLKEFQKFWSLLK